jgi:hypothetical protein
MKTTVNLQDKLIAENRRAIARDIAVLDRQLAMDRETEKLVDRQLDRATAEVEAEKRDVLKTLGMDYKLAEATKIVETHEKFKHLPQERIFTEDAIKRICITYNLRFLSTSLYCGTLDPEIPHKIAELRHWNRGHLPGEARFSEAKFMIAAPKESFVLQERPIDPLLFCHLEGDRYFLVHKWGSDISWLRAVRRFVIRIPAVALGLYGLWMTFRGRADESMATGVVIFVLGIFALMAGIFLAQFNYGQSTDDNWNRPFKK